MTITSAIKITHKLQYKQSLTQLKDAENHFTVDGLKETLMPGLILLQELKVCKLLILWSSIFFFKSCSYRSPLSSRTQTERSSTLTAIAQFLEHRENCNMEYKHLHFKVEYIFNLMVMDQIYRLKTDHAPVVFVQVF